jgi:DNA polymerase-3 subunit chi
MSQVDFHILDRPDNSALLQHTCKLVRKAYRSGHKVYIRVEDKQDMEQLDKLLWTFSELDFIPHTTVDREYGQEPVIIGMIEYAGDERMILVNLSTSMTDNYSSYSRVFEVIRNEPAIISAGRERYRKYRQMNNELTKHDIAVN